MYIVCIMSFVWRTGTTDDANRGPMVPEKALAFRIIISVALSLGLLYFVLIATTLRKYGEMMDQAWHKTIISWVNGTAAEATYSTADSGHLAPSVPFASKPPLVTTSVPFNSQPPVDSGFNPALNRYSTDRPPQESEIPRTRSETTLSPRPHIRQDPNSMFLAGPRPEFSLSNIGQGNNYGTDNEQHNARPGPGPPLPRQSLTTIPEKNYHESSIDLNIPKGPIKLARLLSLSFEGDQPLDVLPSEQELTIFNMTKEQWKVLQIVSVIYL